MTRGPDGTERTPLIPGDAAPGDRDFGPLGGLPDQLYDFARSRERKADTQGERLLRAAGGGRAGPGRFRAAIDDLLRRLDRRQR